MMPSSDGRTVTRIRLRVSESRPGSPSLTASGKLSHPASASDGSTVRVTRARSVTVTGTVTAGTVTVTQRPGLAAAGPRPGPRRRPAIGPVSGRRHLNPGGLIGHE
jgi:hypothetical protein